MPGTVCLSFDFDAFAGDLPDGSPTDLSRGEFAAVGVVRILNLLAARGLEATWFVPGQSAETFPTLCRDIVQAGHELGLHGYAHERASRLSPERERALLARSIDVLGGLAGGAPRGSRAPSWDLSASTLGLLAELGVAYDSSLMAHDYRPYRVRRGDRHDVNGPSHLGEPGPLVEMPISWSLDDWPAFETNGGGRALGNARLVFGNWRDDVTYMLRDFEDGVITMTFHPEVTGRGHRLLGLERLVDDLCAMGLGFARMDRVVEAWLGGRAYGVYRPAAGTFEERGPG